MTRFDASTSADRRKLFVDAIIAHRTRASEGVTVAVPSHSFETAQMATDRRSVTADDPSESESLFGEPDVSHESDRTFPSFKATDSSDSRVTGTDQPGDRRLRFSDGIVILDCTTDELDRLKTQLEDFPAFKIVDTVRSTDSESVTDSGKEMDAETDSKINADSETEMDSETLADSETEMDSETLADSETEMDSETLADSETETEPEKTTVRVSAKADPNRIAQFLDDTARRTYGLSKTYRAWVVSV